jgi:hypothetical protein
MSDQQEEAEVPEGGGSVSFERVRLYLERHPESFNLAGEIDYHDGYVGEDWPRRGYALPRKDIEALLEDCDEYQREVSEAKEAANNLLQQKREWAKHKAQAQALNDMVLSMRMHGARHHFSYGYQRWFEGQGYVDHCKVCDKDKGHPAHFASEATYLDSREVEKASLEALRRVESLLEGMGAARAHDIATEMLRGLPGIPQTIEPQEGP